MTTIVQLQEKEIEKVKEDSVRKKEEMHFLHAKVKEESKKAEEKLRVLIIQSWASAAVPVLAAAAAAPAV